jgi:signal transduction histidine kinase
MKQLSSHAPLSFVLAAFALLIFATPCFAQDGREIPGIERSVVIGGDRDYPPYEFLDKDGKPAGYNVDLSRAIAEVMGMKVEFHLGTWATKYEGLMDGSLDILEGMSFTEGRAQVLDLAPHTIVDHSIYARHGTPLVINLDGLAGKKVIMHRGGVMNEILAAKGFGKDLILTDTPADALRLLASGEGDYAVVAMLPGIYIIRENKLDNIESVARSVFTVRYGYAVKKGNEALLARFSEGLAILRETGRYQAIHDKWLGVLENQNQKVKWQVITLYMGVVVAPLLLLLGGSVLWTYSLRKQVAQRTVSLSNALEELSRNQRQLVQADKMAALGILVSGVAHEINNPNGMILLNIPILRRVLTDVTRLLDRLREVEGEMMLGGIAYDRMRRELPVILDDMQEGAMRIKRIVNDLKEFSKQEEGVGRVLVDVNDASRKAVRLVETTIRKCTDDFSTRYEEDLPMVWASSQRIEQVVVNLVLNACQALPDKSRAIEISTWHDEENHKVVFCVRDEGKGIAPEHLPHLTDPFFTTKRDTGGTGLGLSVSTGILKEYGGSLSFDSVVGQGTAVRMELPAAQEEAQA